MMYAKSTINCHGAKRVGIESITNDFEGFRIIVSETEGKKRKLRIKFPSHLSCRWTDEGDLLRTLGIGGFDGSLLYEVEDSEYKNWFIEESLGRYTGCEDDIRHYAIATQEYIIDVLAFNQPVIECLPV
jgi:hypothetical protein